MLIDVLNKSFGENGFCHQDGKNGEGGGGELLINQSLIPVLSVFDIYSCVQLILLR